MTKITLLFSQVQGIVHRYNEGGAIGRTIDVELHPDGGLHLGGLRYEAIPPEMGVDGKEYDILATSIGCFARPYTPGKLAVPTQTAPLHAAKVARGPAPNEQGGQIRTDTAKAKFSYPSPEDIDAAVHMTNRFQQMRVPPIEESPERRASDAYKRAHARAIEQGAYVPMNSRANAGAVLNGVGLRRSAVVTDAVDMDLLARFSDGRKQRMAELRGYSGNNVLGYDGDVVHHPDTNQSFSASVFHSHLGRVFHPAWVDLPIDLDREVVRYVAENVYIAPDGYSSLRPNRTANFGDLQAFSRDVALMADASAMGAIFVATIRDHEDQPSTMTVIDPASRDEYSAIIEGLVEALAMNDGVSTAANTYRSVDGRIRRRYVLLSPNDARFYACLCPGAPGVVSTDTDTSPSPMPPRAQAPVPQPVKTATVAGVTAAPRVRPTPKDARNTMLPGGATTWGEVNAWPSPGVQAAPQEPISDLSSRFQVAAQQVRERTAQMVQNALKVDRDASSAQPTPVAAAVKPQQVVEAPQNSAQAQPEAPTAPVVRVVPMLPDVQRNAFTMDDPTSGPFKACWGVSVPVQGLEGDVEAVMIPLALLDNLQNTHAPWAGGDLTTPIAAKTLVMAAASDGIELAPAQAESPWNFGGEQLHVIDYTKHGG